METPSVCSPEALFPHVSNPLGWDGDRAESSEIEAERLVSNPLGWDGDCGRSTENSHGRIVSNPLGWDGDRFRQRAFRMQRGFLIH